MWSLIMFVLTVLSVIYTWRLINFGVRTANRIAVATENSALMLQILYDCLSDEAKERGTKHRADIVEAVAKIKQPTPKAKPSAGFTFSDIGVPALVGLIALSAAILLMILGR